jgi:predicted DNA-binding transcriptional regulator YafY
VGIWYSIGYCHLREGQRLLRLDRILAAELTDDTFSAPADFDAVTAVRLALVTVPRTWRVEVWLEMTLDDARRQTRLSKGHFVDTGDGALIRVEVADLP